MSDAPMPTWKKVSFIRGAVQLAEKRLAFLRGLKDSGKMIQSEHAEIVICETMIARAKEMIKELHT